MPRFQTPPIQGQPFLDDKEPAQAWKRWFELIQAALTSPAVPTVANSAGSPVEVQGLATDGTYLYVCIGTNSWKKILLSAL